MVSRCLVMATLLVLGMAELAAAQNRRWGTDLSIGYAGFVDEATDHYFLAGGSVRRYLTARVSVGPEIVVMSNPGELRDLNLLITGNVMYERGDPATSVAPFLIGGVGVFRGREQLAGGSFWFSDPAFTAGGGVRVRVSDALSVAGEYRIGWELHQRISATLGLRW
jgi:opacity protein-like surface antigen